ncbi:MAG: hypothetical protein DMG58_01940 [Acidobacteria bacterium]|nr:MAG: hypothetical protein DMG58_01940 [Acidobacteriota bacterium]
MIRLLAIACCLLPIGAYGQSMRATGAMQVTVVDSTGSIIIGVRITATNADTGATRSAETDNSGQTRFSGLAVGSYTLRLEKEGFAAVRVQAFPVSVGQTVVRQFEMRPAQVNERLEVTDQPEALETAATTSSVALGNERIEEAPAQNRNYLNFVLVAPGVAASSGSNTQRAAAGVRSTAADSGFTFGGMRGRNNSLSIDGVDNRDETTGANRVSIGLEMVEEFRVSGTSISADSGGAAGGNVNVVTRSGTNIWHGDATYFTQNEFTNARDADVESPGKPRFRRYQPGVSLLGPIWRNRTFFSTAFEQEWELGEEFSEDPTHSAAVINRALADPRYARAAIHQVNEGLFPTTASSTEFSFKLNHQLNDEHSLSARYAFSRGRVFHDMQSLDNFTDRSARGSSLTQDQSFVAGWMAVPSPSLVNDFRLQVAARTVDLSPNARGALLEIPGVLSLGQAYGLDSERAEDHYEVIDSVNTVRGRHQFGFGASLHYVRLDADLANRFAGIFLFPTLDDFARARPDVFIQAFGNPHTEMTAAPLGVWIEDRWQPVSGLTIEAGARYEGERLPKPFTSPTHNFSPRLGVAWRPRGTSFVLRGGFGLFYDRYPLAFLNDALQKDGTHGFEQYATGDVAVGALQLGLGGTLDAPLPALAPSLYRPDSHFPTTYSRKFIAGAERSLNTDTTLSIEYAYVRGFHLPRVRNIDLSLPPLYQLEMTARSFYQGAAVTLHRRMSKEWTYLIAYNVGSAWDDGSDFDEQPSHPADARRDWAHSRQHQAQRVVASGLFEVRAEEMQSAPGWLRETLEDFHIAPIFSVGSGRPLNALDSTDRFRTGAYPITARPFDLPRNPFTQEGAASMDLRLMKVWWVVQPRRVAIELAADIFNLANHTNPLRVSPFYAAGTAKLPTYGGLVETLNARQIQFSLSLEY